MKKKILLFEPEKLFRNTLMDQISLNKDFDVMEASVFDDVLYQLEKSSFDLTIMGTDIKTYRLSTIGRFIKDSKIKSVVLFMIEAETSEVSSFEESIEKHYFIEKPFRIHHFKKTISTILAKISNSNELTHKIGPFTFFPLKKIIMLGDETRVELTEKEVDILKCLINSDEGAVDRDDLLKQVWNYSSDVTTHTLETHIYRLRQKLEMDPSIPRLIISKGGSFAIRSL